VVSCRLHMILHGCHAAKRVRRVAGDGIRGVGAQSHDEHGVVEITGRDARHPWLVHVFAPTSGHSSAVFAFLCFCEVCQHADAGIFMNSSQSWLLAQLDCCRCTSRFAHQLSSSALASAVTVALSIFMLQCLLVCFFIHCEACVATQN